MSIERSVNLAYGFLIPADNKIALDALSDHLLAKEYKDDLGQLINDIYDTRALEYYPGINVDTSMDHASGSIEPALMVFIAKSNRSLYGNYENFNPFRVNAQEVNPLAKEKLHELLKVVNAVSPEIESDFVVWMNIS